MGKYYYNLTNTWLSKKPMAELSNAFHKNRSTNTIPRTLFGSLNRTHNPRVIAPLNQKYPIMPRTNAMYSNNMDLLEKAKLLVK